MKKQDATLMRQLKREEEQSKKTKTALGSEQENDKGKVSFDIWWAGVAKQLNLPTHIKEIVWADFNSRGLKKEEPAKVYGDTLNLFGYRI